MHELREVLDVRSVQAGAVRGLDIVVYAGRPQQVVGVDRLEKPVTKLILRDSTGSRVQIVLEPTDFLDLLLARPTQGAP